ncbi:MAG TPA: preprotein translocase subunit SecE [Dehalococcoidia bacterium]|nr:preprotein translocase subunit SecE [Dehalococcoidia bacterium]
MNRALRRHPIVTRQAPKGRPPRLPGRPPTGPRPARGGLRFLPQFAVEVWSELKKVTWPSRETTFHLTVVVVVVAVALGAVLGGVDAAFAWLIEKLLLSRSLFG